MFDISWKEKKKAYNTSSSTRSKYIFFQRDKKYNKLNPFYELNSFVLLYRNKIFRIIFKKIIKIDVKMLMLL